MKTKHEHSLLDNFENCGILTSDDGKAAIFPHAEMKGSVDYVCGFCANTFPKGSPTVSVPPICVAELP